MSQQKKPAKYSGITYIVAALTFLILISCEKEMKEGQTVVPEPENTVKTIVLSGFDNNPGWKTMEKQFTNMAANANIKLKTLTAQGPNYLRSQREQVIPLVNDSLNGMVLWPADEVGLFDPINELKKRSIPTVTIGIPLQDNIQISVVSTDEKLMAKAALSELQTAMGDKNKVLLFYFSGESENSPDMLPAIRKALVSYFPKFEIVAEQSFSSPEEAAAFAEAEKSFLLNPQVQGVLCTHPQGALGVIRALKDIDRAISTPVVTIGYHESLNLQLQSKALYAAVEKDFSETAKAAFEILNSYMESGKPVSDSLIPPQIINGDNLSGVSL